MNNKKIIINKIKFKLSKKKKKKNKDREGFQDGS
jgi:hypothetical protein